MSLSASDADDRVRQLTALTEQLTARITAETRAFEARRPQDAQAGLAETQRLANLYRHEASRIRREPGLIDGADPTLRSGLRQAVTAFEAALGRHARALEAARVITEGLVKAVAEEVAAARPQAAGYGPAARTPAGSAGPIAFNRRA